MAWKGFSEIVRVEMAKRHWKLRDLVASTGIPRSTASHIINGGAPSYKNLILIMQALNIHFLALGEQEPAQAREPGVVYGSIPQDPDQELLAEIRRRQRG